MSDTDGIGYALGTNAGIGGPRAPYDVYAEVRRDTDGQLLGWPGPSGSDWKPVNGA